MRAHTGIHLAVRLVILGKCYVCAHISNLRKTYAVPLIGVSTNKLICKKHDCFRCFQKKTLTFLQ
jgi:hypothetical protein